MTKADRLLRRITTLHEQFKDDDDHPSRLERDLMLGYLRELYEVYTQVEGKHTQVKAQNFASPPTPVDRITASAQISQPTSDPAPRNPSVPPQHPASSPAAADSTQDTPAAAQRTEAAAPPPPAAPTPKAPDTPPKPDVQEQYPTNQPIAPGPPPENHSPAAPPVPDAPIPPPVAPSLTKHTAVVAPEISDRPAPNPPQPAPSPNQSPEVEELFEETAGHGLANRMVRQRVTDLNRALSINNRVLFANKLFGSNEELNQALKELNLKGSMANAKPTLVDFAQQHQWAQEGRRETAREFIDLVRRRYA